MAVEHEDKLREEILADATRKARRATERAERDAAKARQSAEAENERLREQLLDESGRRADEQATAVLASIDHERRRRWLLNREQVLDAMSIQALTQIAMLPAGERRESLRQLLREALDAVRDPAVVIHAPPAAAAILEDGLAAAVARELFGDSAAVTVVDDGVADGLTVVAADGRRRYDNTYAERLRRSSPDLRVRALTILEGAEQEQDVSDEHDE